MSQAILNIADGTGSAVLAEINNALLNLATLCSGSTDPSTLTGGVQPLSLWMDTTSTTNVLKQRNAANTGWNTLLTVNQSTGATNLANLDAAQAFTKAQRGAAVSLTSTSASIAVDASLANNFTHTFTENTTLANPTNLVAGQSGVIVLTQHASAPKTLAYGSYWKFASGTVPSVTATNSAVDVLAYYVESSTRITARLIGDVK